MSMGGGGSGGFGRPQGGFQMPQRGGMQQGVGRGGYGMQKPMHPMGGDPMRGMSGGVQQLGRHYQSGGVGGLLGGTGGMHPYQNSSLPPTPQPPVDGSNGRPIADPPGAFGFPQQRPTDGSVSGGGWNGGGYTPQPGMTGIQNPGAAQGAPVSGFGGGARGPMQSATDLFQNQGMGSMGGQNMGAPGGQSWDGLSQLDLQGASGSMPMNLAALQGLGKTGLNISGLQMGNDASAGRNGSLWVNGPNGQRLGGVDQVTGKPLPFDLSNLDPNGQYSLGWSGAGPQGMRVMGRGR